MTEDNPREGSIYWRALPDGYEVCVYPMTFGKARLVYSIQDDPGIIDGYCYASPARAIEAAKAWTGEGDPLDGWHRHPTSGRRRDGGDPSKEYVYR